MSKYFREVNRFPLLSPEEEADLAQRIREGDKNALDRLVNSNLRLVISVANQYVGLGLDLLDLINEGNIGLMKAAKHFDETRGFKFITYAVAWIKQAILSALSNIGCSIRLPQNRIAGYHRMQNYITEYEQKHECCPGVGDIARDLAISTEQVKILLRSKMTGLSLDVPLKEGEGGTFLDIIPNKNAPSADDWAEHCSLQDELERSLSALPEKEEKIVRLYYGIGCSALTLEKIGEIVNLSTERVRQLKRNALRSMGTFPNSKTLRSFL